MNTKTVFIYLTAYSPRFNIIASLRAEKISKYVSDVVETFVIAGIPRGLENASASNNMWKPAPKLNKAKLIEIPTINQSNYANNEKQNTRSDSPAKKRIKMELLPLLEMILPISPGGLLYHNYKKYYSELEKIITENYVDKRIVIFASYGPAFILKLAKHIKNQFPKIFLINDFRDWAYKYYEGVFYNTGVFKKFTKSLISESNLLTFVSKTMMQEYTKYFSIDESKTEYLPNGYDPEDYKELLTLKKKRDGDKDSFRIVYTGSFHEKSRNPSPFLEALTSLSRKSPGLVERIKFIYAGKDETYIEDYFRRYNLSSMFESKGFLDRLGSIQLQNSADLLLLIAYTGKNDKIGNSIATGKVYEYLNGESPILCIAPEDWDLKDVLEADGVSKVIPATRTKNISDYIMNLCRTDSVAAVLVNKRADFIGRFSYKTISKRLLDIL